MANNPRRPPTVTSGPDGRIVSVRLEEDKDLIGIRASDVVVCVEALDAIARSKRPKNPATVVRMLCKQGWLTPQGRITTRGERFRDFWHNRPFVRA